MYTRTHRHKQADKHKYFHASERRWSSSPSKVIRSCLRACLYVMFLRTRMSLRYSTRIGNLNGTHVVRERMHIYVRKHNTSHSTAHWFPQNTTLNDDDDDGGVGMPLRDYILWERFAATNTIRWMLACVYDNIVYHSVYFERISNLVPTLEIHTHTNAE